jgi:hypothetical protein
MWNDSKTAEKILIKFDTGGGGLNSLKLLKFV